MRPMPDCRIGFNIARLAMIALAILAPAVAHAQSQHPPAAGPTKTWTPKLTPDGQPDIQGVWTNFDPTPFEAPGEDDATRLAALRRWFPPGDPVTTPPRPAVPSATREVSGFADGPAGAPRNARRRSMVVDPPSGRAPIRPEAAAKRDDHLTHLTDSWEHHTPWERCITRGVPAGIFPPGYGAGYRILQVPGYVVILYEMIHEARIIPVDGSPHVPSGIRLWNGDSRGRWEGNTLVVDIANYNDKGSIATNIATQGVRGIPQSEALHVVERFTLVNADTINYEVTIEDPPVYTAPWKVAMPMNRDASYRIFEYACHEGNYGLMNSLSAGRAEDRASAGSKR
jgi:hypothetical protein